MFLVFWERRGRIHEGNFQNLDKVVFLETLWWSGSSRNNIKSCIVTIRYFIERRDLFLPISVIIFRAFFSSVFSNSYSIIRNVRLQVCLSTTFRRNVFFSAAIEDTQMDVVVRFSKPDLSAFIDKRLIFVMNFSK